MDFEYFIRKIGFEEEDIKGAVIDIKKHLNELKSNYSHLKDLFIPIKNKQAKEYGVKIITENECYDILNNN